MKKTTLTEIIRAEIRKANRRGITRAQITKACKLKPGRLAEFMAGKRSLTAEHADRLAASIGKKITLV
jgi:plasmid maintenance system antidote protein VapI